MQHLCGAMRILKVLTLTDERLWMDYARFAGEKELKRLFAIMAKWEKTKKDKKINKNEKILLINVRGALLLNENEMVEIYFEKLGLKEDYRKKQMELEEMRKDF